MRKELEAILGKLDLDDLSPGERKLLGDLPNYLDLVERDGLTGVYNKRKFNADLEAAVAGADRGGKDVSLIMIDVDDFKAVNDKYGHPKGDEVLKSVTKALSESLRGHEKDNLYRYGGEEYAVIIPDTNAEEGAIVAERLRQAVEKNCGLEERDITISLGVANYKDTCSNPDDFIKRADSVLYQAKRKGKNQVVVDGRDKQLAQQLELPLYE